MIPSYSLFFRISLTLEPEVILDMPRVSENGQIRYAQERPVRHSGDVHAIALLRVDVLQDAPYGCAL
jgi:hypothetical protein